VAKSSADGEVKLGIQKKVSRDGPELSPGTVFVPKRCSAWKMIEAVRGPVGERPCQLLGLKSSGSSHRSGDLLSDSSTETSR
jgi:hypothetical protein